jgi:hypothetical protein
MPKSVKFLIGLAAALAAGWISHGPLGRGDQFIDRMDADLQLILGVVNLPGVSGRMQREPLARTAILSGKADPFQREGMGSLPGIDDRVMMIPGMGRFEWTD